MNVFGQMEAGATTNQRLSSDYHVPFDQGLSKTRSSALQKDAIDNEVDRD